MTRTAGRDEYPGQLSLQVPARPLLALASGGDAAVVALDARLRAGTPVRASTRARQVVRPPRLTRAGDNTFVVWDSVPAGAPEDTEWTLLARRVRAPLSRFPSPVHTLATGSCATASR